MTVIAGVSLFNGVMLLSDCRVTVKSRGRANVYCDIAQKVFPLTPSTVIGFSGDVSTAAFILRQLITQMKRRVRRDAISLLQWLPRFLRAGYRVYGKNNKARDICFMVGSIIPGRPNVIARQKVVELMNIIGLGTSSMQRNWVPDILVRILQTPPNAKFVMIPGTVQGVLYTMMHPNFKPKYFQPLEYCAIGSGNGATYEIARTADWVLAGEPGNDMIESWAMRDAVSQFITSKGLNDVGGMYPCVKVDQRGVVCLGLRQELPLYEIRLSFDNARTRWIQENRTNGKKVELLYPWEITANTTKSDMRFDDWQEAIEHFIPSRAQTVKTSPN